MFCLVSIVQILVLVPCILRLNFFFRFERATFRFTCLSPNQNFKKDARQSLLSTLQTDFSVIKPSPMEKLRHSLESSAQYTSNESSPISLGHSVQALTSDETGRVY